MREKPEILIVENDRSYQLLYHELLQHHFAVRIARTAEAHQAIDAGNYASVVANCHNRYRERLAMDGFGVLRYARSQGLMSPFIFLAEAPDEFTMREADHYGAFEVIPKGTPDFYSRLLNCLTIASSFHEYQSELHKKRRNDICEALCYVPHVTRINWDYRDENLYQAFFEIDSRRNKYCYANSWDYICQAARRNGHKYFDGATLITIEASMKEGEYEFEIIRPLGHQATKKAFELAKKLKTLTNRPVIFKRLESDQAENLQARGCKKLDDPATGVLEEYSDDIYPQVVIDLRRFAFNLSLPEMKWFRYGLRQFTKRNYIMRDMIPSLYQDVREVLSRWKQGFVSRYQRKAEFKSIPQEDNYYFDPYLPFVEHFGKFTKRNQSIATLFCVDNTPVGFSFYVRVSHCCMAMYANIGDTYFEGLSYFMLYQNFLRAQWAGYTHVNLGGTETKSLFDFYHRLTGNAQGNPNLLHVPTSQNLILERTNLML